jgi:hypothetical protein
MDRFREIVVIPSMDDMDDVYGMDGRGGKLKTDDGTLVAIAGVRTNMKKSRGHSWALATWD